MFLRQIMEDFADPAVRNITCMCSAQSAKTLTFLVLLCWAIAEDPGAILWVTKNEDEAKKIAKSRVKPMFNDCVPVAKRLPKNRNDNNTLEVYFPGAPLVIASSENEAALQSTPFRYLFLDERRAYKDGAAEMVSKRTRAFAHSFKKVTISTPDEEGDGLHLDFQDGNQCEWNVMCPNPDCGHEQPLVWKDGHEKGGMKWDTNERTKPSDGVYNFDELIKTVRWECEMCGHQVRDTPRERKALANHGRWVPGNLNAAKDTKSYHWNALLPWWADWGNQVREFLTAKTATKWGNFTKLKSWVNETSGRPWTDRLRYTDDERFIEARGVYYDPRENIPWETRRFMTIDVQGKGGRHYWYVIRAWGRGAKTKLLAEGRCWTKEEWEQLAVEWNVSPDNVIIDSGAWASEIYRHVVDSGYRYKAFKGEDKTHFTRDGKRSIWQKTPADPAIGTAMQGKVKPLDLFLFSKPSALDRLYLMMNGELGEWSYPLDQDGNPAVSREYLLQVTAYDKRPFTDLKKNKVRYEWHQKRTDDHQAANEVQQIVAATITGLIYEDGDEVAE